jgi:hypothetical protein
MEPRPSTLVLDDGELADVRTTLEEIGVEYTYLRGGATEGLHVAPPTQLLVATPRRAMRLDPAAAADPDDGTHPVRIVVTDQDSVGMRNQLRSVGFDYLVRRPIHPGALRLLLLRAIYRGPERRVTIRYPIGGPIAYRMGLRKKPATLLEVSLRGCRLQTESEADLDARINVILSKDFTGGKSLTVSGWVVRCLDSTDGGYEVGVAFESLSASTERGLRTVLKRKIQGLDTGIEENRSAPTSEEIDDRRHGQRGELNGSIEVHDQAARALVGRNLSTGGMLIEQNLDLRIGDTTTLEIFGREGDSPIRVRAQVLRDDGSGMALQFVNVTEESAERLEGLVSGLPAIERLADSEAEAMGTVVAEIVNED